MAEGNNMIHMVGSKDAQIAFIKSSIDSCKTVIAHYDFVINDISSDISNVKLQATKRPTLTFLKEMRQEWVNCQLELEQELQKRL